MITDIERDHDGGVLLVSVFLDVHRPLTLILDTGAGSTTLDITELILAGYDLGNPLGSQLNETANGIVTAEIFEIREFSALGISRKNYRVQVYDFLAHGMISNYQGLLGMDFFEGTKFCIDTVKNLISIEPILA